MGRRGITVGKGAVESAEFERIRTRYIEIYAQLQTEPVGTRRSQLVNEAFALRKTTPGQL